jgi:hypothetical protein
MIMRSRIFASLVAATVALLPLGPTFADERHDGDRHDFRHDGRHGDDFRRHGAFRDHDIRRFHDHDFDVWRGGHWIHGRHDGRRGWWWIVGPSWYFYPAPIYPYPDPLVPAYAAPGASAWYFCPPAQAYYPYVPTCPVPWQAVPTY